MNILHLSDTTLSGSPIRIAGLFNKYTEHKARHLVWMPKVYDRVFPTDKVGLEMKRDEIMALFEWADVLHYHNRFRRQLVFRNLGIPIPKRPSVIQMHSPRESEDFSQEVASGIPIAVIAQYHVRQWPEAKFIVPNVVDIEDPLMIPKGSQNVVPKVSYAPSNTNAKGWDDKGYGQTSTILKRMSLERKIIYQLIVKRPWLEAMELKQSADIGVDEMVTGSYHLSSLEYLSMGCVTFAHIDEQTERVVKDLTGAHALPWCSTKIGGFKPVLDRIIQDKQMIKNIQTASRFWMEEHWSPKKLINHYEGMYAQL